MTTSQIGGNASTPQQNPSGSLMESTKNDVIGHEPTTSDIDNVQTMIKGLYIERKHDKQVTPNFNKHNNPFKHKSLKKQKRKLSICYNSSQCKEILVNLDTSNKTITDKESGAMINISEKLAKSWNEDGYRESTLKSLESLTLKDDSLIQLNEQTKVTAPNTSETNSENSTQVASQTCARQAMCDYCDSSVTELAAYLDETLFIPKKMSFMAEMMYT